jgi:hypothetical protein
VAGLCHAGQNVIVQAYTITRALPSAKNINSRTGLFYPVSLAGVRFHPSQPPFFAEDFFFSAIGTSAIIFSEKTAKMVHRMLVSCIR